MDKELPSTSYASKREQDLLLKLYEARKDILEDRKTEFSMKGKLKKAEAWKAIEKDYNFLALGRQKNIAQLKRMWQHMKGRAKKEKKEAMRTGGGLPKLEDEKASPSTIRILSTISQELESTGNGWDSDALPNDSNSAIDHELVDEAVIIVDQGSVEPGSTPQCNIQPAQPTPLVSPASPSTTQSGHPAPASSQPAHPLSSASTPCTQQRRLARAALTPQEELLSMWQEEHAMEMKIKEVDLKIKEADLVLKKKDIKLKDADLLLKELELKIKEKEYLSEGWYAFRNFL